MRRKHQCGRRQLALERTKALVKGPLRVDNMTVAGRIICNHLSLQSAREVSLENVPNDCFDHVCKRHLRRCDLDIILAKEIKSFVMPFTLTTLLFWSYTLQP